MVSGQSYRRRSIEFYFVIFFHVKTVATDVSARLGIIALTITYRRTYQHRPRAFCADPT